ncbi:MAG: methylglyoxal synthase [Chloroflexi bacterium]|nr:methylglyoxal synthase [Chloroflexota bacterium]MCY3976737.1 methylglyoxal synthase [Chloroflexota bacterium]MDE2637296.1 methylglyoxal synthase [Chloroflexota bacterium]
MAIRPKRKTLALISHDGKKADMVAFVMDHKERLREFDLVATGTTGTLIKDKTGLDVRCVLSGPYGGDAQIAGLVAEERVNAVFFFLDPLGKHPHDPDIQGLLRICNVHNVPLATNIATAVLLINA